MIGNDILIVLTCDGVDVGTTTIRSHDITVKGEAIEKASSTQQEFREFIAGRTDWEVNVSYLVKLVSDVQFLKLVNKTFTLTMKYRTDSSALLTGEAILITCKQAYTRGNLITGSFQFTGTGALT